VPETILREVSVYHRDPQLASDIANAVVESLQESYVKNDREAMERWLRYRESEIEGQRTLVEKARQNMNDLKERGEIIDPEPEHLTSISTGASKTSISQYEAAKNRFMTQKRILEAGELKFREDKQSEPRRTERIEIRERADPFRHQAYFDPQRVWRRHKLMWIAGFATVCLGIGAAIICAVKYLSRTLDPLPGQENRGIDTVTYDY
jgi:hypothetical protein